MLQTSIAFAPRSKPRLLNMISVPIWGLFLNFPIFLIFFLFLLPAFQSIWQCLLFCFQTLISHSCVLSCVSTDFVSDSLWSYGLYSPWNSPGQNTGVVASPFSRGIFPTQGSYPGFPLCGQILYQLSHKGSPRILEWLDYPFSSRSSWPRNWTWVSCIAGRFFTTWATWETT